MIREGLVLMAIGMSGVFVFLVLLVGLIHASGRIFVVLARWLPEPPSAKASPSTFGPAAAFDEEEIAVALAVAVGARAAAGAVAGKAGASGAAVLRGGGNA